MLTTAVESIPITDVIVGERARRDYGDLTALKESIREVGLLQPIGLTPGDHLLFGGRRLEACRALGWERIPFVRPSTRDDALSLLTAERDENTCRKDMTLEELVDLGLRLEKLEAPRAAARKAEGGELGRESRYGTGSPSGEGKPAARTREGETNETVGKALGLSGTSYFRAKHVVQAARSDADPKLKAVAHEALYQLNAGKRTVSSAYEKVRKARQAAAPPPEQERPPKNPTFAIPQPPKHGGNRRKHRQIMERLIISLSGLTAAADEIIQFDSSITHEEATQFLRDLSPQIQSLNRIKALLKEYMQ